MLNKVILIGNLGNDPEVKQTNSGGTLASFSVATTDRWRDKNGQTQEQTEWHRVVTWNKLAEICGQYLRKGSKVYIEGKLQTRTWEDQQGVTRYMTEVLCREMKMLDSRPQSSAPQRYEDAPTTFEQSPQRTPEQQAWVKPDPHRHNPPGYHDEVPF